MWIIALLQWIPTPDWSRGIGPMRMRPNPGKRQAFPLPMHEIGGKSNTKHNTSTDREEAAFPSTSEAMHYLVRYEDTKYGRGSTKD